MILCGHHHMKEDETDDSVHVGKSDTKLVSQYKHMVKLIKRKCEERCKQLTKVAKRFQKLQQKKLPSDGKS